MSDRGEIVQPERAALALGLGATAGGTLTAFGLTGTMSTSAQEVLTYSPLLIAIAVVASVSWGIGLTVIGLPAWSLLHRFGLRGWRTALISGALLSLIASLLLSMALQVRTQPIRDPAELWPELGLSLVGAAVGLLIWRVAYPAGPDRPPESV